MSHKKKAYQKMIAGGAVPKRTHHLADAVMLEGDAECHYYRDNGIPEKCMPCFFRLYAV